MRTVAAMLLLGAFASGCDNSSAKILERLDAATPPGSNLRLDVFVVRLATTCAIGPACARADPGVCFTLSDSSGPQIQFDPNQVQFVPPGDARIATAEQSRCFALGLDAGQVAAIGDQTTSLRSLVFQATRGEMNLDIRLHEIAAAEVSFINYQGGVFLRPTALGSMVQSVVNRDTDFVDVVTGFDDRDSGLMPTMNQCAGTGRPGTDSGQPANGGVGSPFSWIGLSPRCLQETAFLSTFMIQLWVGLHDVTRFTGLYDQGYPGCGMGQPDPGLWFPETGDCTRDPDVSTCGRGACPDLDTFYTHILSAHWPRGRAYSGNHCSDGRMDFDETAIDEGGLCDVIGR